MSAYDELDVARRHVERIALDRTLDSSCRQLHVFLDYVENGFTCDTMVEAYRSIKHVDIDYRQA